MATETTNYKFKKPDNTDFYNIADQNGNWDKCDKQLKALDDGKAATTHEHTIAEITDLPTKLPADGGDADTVGGLPPSAFLNVHSKATDITWDPTTYPLGCWSAEGSLSTAHGHPVTSPSLHITYYMTGQTNDANGYRTLLAITADGRMFLKVQQWAGWSAWIDLKDATTLGGLTVDKFAQYVDKRLQIRREGNNEGGQINFQSPLQDTLLTQDVIMDIYKDTFRLYSTVGSEVKGIQLNIPALAGGFHNLAFFRAVTTDITAGVTPIGQNALYIVYE